MKIEKILMPWKSQNFSWLLLCFVYLWLDELYGHSYLWKSRNTMAVHRREHMRIANIDLTIAIFSSVCIIVRVYHCTDYNYLFYSKAHCLLIVITFSTAKLIAYSLSLPFLQQSTLLTHCHYLFYSKARCLLIVITFSTAKLIAYSLSLPFLQQSSLLTHCHYLFYSKAHCLLIVITFSTAKHIAYSLSLPFLQQSSLLTHCHYLFYSKARCLLIVITFSTAKLIAYSLSLPFYSKACRLLIVYGGQPILETFLDCRLV